jgi:hypothetical protein
MTFRAYFYKGTRSGVAGIYNRAVRARFRGQYSHVELSFSDGWSASASFEDGGTRFKMIDYSPDNWDYVDLPAEWEPYARGWFLYEATGNKGYDILGNIYQAIGFISHDSARRFCSEAVAAALQIQQAERFEPNQLYIVLKRLVAVYNEAQIACQRAA